MLFQQNNIILAWLICLSLVTTTLSNLATNQFSRQLVANSSNYQCQPQTSMCNYFNYYGTKGFNNRTLLRAGFCATYDKHTRLVTFTECPYFQPNSDYAIFKDDCNTWHTQLPRNISELNDYMCGPLNRKGRVCSECKDGFGPAVGSFGFQIQCSNCTASGWYGILLYMVIEIVPVTIFYFALILVFQINITSAPMPAISCTAS